MVTLTPDDRDHKRTKTHTLLSKDRQAAGRTDVLSVKYPSLFSSPSAVSLPHIHTTPCQTVGANKYYMFSCNGTAWQNHYLCCGNSTKLGQYVNKHSTVVFKYWTIRCYFYVRMCKSLTYCSFAGTCLITISVEVESV